MMSATKWISICGVLVAGLAVSGLVTEAVATPGGAKNTVACVLDVTVETINQTGVVVGSEVYHKEFSLVNGGFFSDDFSTRTRFKVMDAAMTTANGKSTISMDWFADVTVFDSVDVSTSVVLGGARKDGTSTGSHTFYTSNSSTRTTYTLSCFQL